MLQHMVCDCIGDLYIVYKRPLSAGRPENSSVPDTVSAYQYHTQQSLIDLLTFVFFTRYKVDLAIHTRFPQYQHQNINNMRAVLASSLFAAGALAAPGFPFFGFGQPGNNNNNGWGNGWGQPAPQAPAPAVATVQATSTVTNTVTQTVNVQTQVTSTWTLTTYMPVETTVFNTWTLTEWDFGEFLES